MRMRKKKNGIVRIEACSDYILTKKEEIDKLREKNCFPCVLEIGCGKGDFAIQMSKRLRDVPYIAMEVVSDVALCALEKAKESQCSDNLMFLIANAKNLNEYFEKGDIQTIYLNFSDPWPKKGHYKRRLTYRAFLEIYKSLLTDDGQIILKTDNENLFDFSLEEFEECGFLLSDLTRDLHASSYNAENVQTEYERNFSSKGFKIHRVVAQMTDHMKTGIEKRPNKIYDPVTKTLK